MNVFAVFMASIAALAASAQAYFIWTMDDARKSDWLEQSVIASRSSTCSSLLRASGALERALATKDDIIAEVAAKHLAELEKYAPEADADKSAARQEEALLAGRAAFVEAATDGMYHVVEFIDVDYIYFSEAELDTLEYSTWRSFADRYSRYSSLTPLYGYAMKQEEEFSELVETAKFLSVRKPSLQEFCAPLMSPKA